MLIDLNLELDAVEEELSELVLKESLEKVKKEVGERYSLYKSEGGVMKSFLVKNIYDESVFVGLEGDGRFRVEIKGVDFDRVVGYER